MKILSILCAMLISIFALNTLSASGINKNSSMLDGLGSAWKTYPSIKPKPNTNDITIVYGGADVSHRPGENVTIVT